MADGGLGEIIKKHQEQLGLYGNLLQQDGEIIRIMVEGGSTAPATSAPATPASATTSQVHDSSQSRASERWKPLEALVRNRPTGYMSDSYRGEIFAAIGGVWSPNSDGSWDNDKYIICNDCNYVHERGKKDNLTTPYDNALIREALAKVGVIRNMPTSRCGQYKTSSDSIPTGDQSAEPRASTPYSTNSVQGIIDAYFKGTWRTEKSKTGEEIGAWDLNWLFCLNCYTKGENNTINRKTGELGDLLTDEEFRLLMTAGLYIGANICPLHKKEYVGFLLSGFIPDKAIMNNEARANYLSKFPGLPDTPLF